MTTKAIKAMKRASWTLQLFKDCFPKYWEEYDEATLALLREAIELEERKNRKKP